MTTPDKSTQSPPTGAHERFEEAKRAWHMIGTFDEKQRMDRLLRLADAALGEKDAAIAAAHARGVAEAAAYMEITAWPVGGKMIREHFAKGK